MLILSFINLNQINFKIPDFHITQTILHLLQAPQRSYFSLWSPLVSQKAAANIVNHCGVTKGERRPLMAVMIFAEDSPCIWNKDKLVIEIRPEINLPLCSTIQSTVPYLTHSIASSNV